MSSKRERLEAAIAGGVADRPPVALWRHFPVDDQSPQDLARATIAYHDRFDFDFVKVTPASSFCLTDWGVEDQWQGETEGTRTYTRRVIESSQDWRNLSELDPNEGGLGRQIACLQILQSGLSENTPFIQTIFSPLAQAKNLAGGRRMLEHLRRSPDDLLFGLEVITRSTLAFIQAAKDTAMAGIFYAIQHGTYLDLDDAAYDRFGLPFDRRILDAVSDLWLNVLHLHGHAVMFRLAQMLPVQVVNWHDRETAPTLSEGRQLFRGAVCGGLRREATMVLGSPADVRSEAHDAIQSTGGLGLILGAGCVVPISAPDANLRAARQAVEGQGN